MAKLTLGAFERQIRVRQLRASRRPDAARRILQLIRADRALPGSRGA